VQDAASELAAGAPGARLSGIDVTPEGRWLLAPAVAAGALQVLIASADGREGSETLAVSGPAGDGRAEVRISP
jgi:hypothetical protein